MDQNVTPMLQIILILKTRENKKPILIQPLYTKLLYKNKYWAQSPLKLGK